MTEWQTGVPPQHGYYLVAWKRGDNRLTVSELWFNPDAIRKWWFTRAYGGDPQRRGMDNTINAEVVAWMPIPDPPEQSPHEKSPQPNTPMDT
jgi:hypothetical protein